MRRVHASAAAAPQPWRQNSRRPS